MGPFWRWRNTHRVSPQLAFTRAEWKRKSVLRWYMSGRSEQSNIPVLCAVCILAWMLQSGTTVPFWLKTSLMWVPLFLPKPSLPSTENWGSSVLEKKRMEPRLRSSHSKCVSSNTLVCGVWVHFGGDATPTEFHPSSLLHELSEKERACYADTCLGGVSKVIFIHIYYVMFTIVCPLFCYLCHQPTIVL